MTSATAQASPYRTASLIWFYISGVTSAGRAGTVRVLVFHYAQYRREATSSMRSRAPEIRLSGRPAFALQGSLMVALRALLIAIE